MWLGWKHLSPTSPVSDSSKSASASFALQTLERLELGGFETLPYIQAVNLLNQAKVADPDEPRVWVVYSQMALNRGYRRGDRYREASFAAEFLTIAEDWADKGLAAVPEEPMAHVQKAKLQIIRGQLKEAWAQTDRARALDGDGFYPWYLRGIVSRRMRDLPRARNYFSEAEALAGNPIRASFVHGQLIHVAIDAEDFVEAERLHRRLVDVHPPSAHDRFNFGLFLEWRGRKDEAMQQYESAAKIAMFPALRSAMAELAAQRQP